MHNRQQQISARFIAFHRENPVVFKLFKRFALMAIFRGWKNYSSDAIMHRLRWHLDIETTGEPFKINNNFTPYYARLFELAQPEHEGFFRKRKLISADKAPYEHETTIVSDEIYDIEEDVVEQLRQLLPPLT